MANEKLYYVEKCFDGLFSSYRKKILYSLLDKH